MPLGKISGAVLAALICVSLVAALVFAVLPGFSVQPLGNAGGFISSIVIDSRGVIYYTTVSGEIARFPDNSVLARVETEAVGNSGLLGMALRDDNTAIVHYTTRKQTHDVVSAIDLTTGKETVVTAFVCNRYDPSFGVSSEHHGGNPIVADDGSIFVAIGDGYSANMAPLPEWNLGKVFRIFPDGRVEQFARGVRNPFDLAWDAAKKRLIIPDNGDHRNDEINVVRSGASLGWPYAMPGDMAPLYTFSDTVAPTGIVAMNGKNPMLPRGYVMAGFVPRALYYIADIYHPAPIPLIEGVTGPIVDVTRNPSGDIYFAAGRAIYKLNVPQRGDCDGDGDMTSTDLPVLISEVGDGGEHPATRAQDGTVRGSWGCDVDGDGLIREDDIALLKARLTRRMRTVR